MATQETQSSNSIRFFKRLGKQFGEPRTLVTDKAPSLAFAFKQLQSEGLFITTTHRTNKYSNNIIEQDHRAIKKRHMFYRSIRTASSTIKGLETVHALYKKRRKEGNLFDFSIWNECKQLMRVSA